MCGKFSSYEFERLESRRLLDGSFAIQTGSQLLVAGTSGDDTISIRNTGGNLIATLNGVDSQTFNSSSITSIFIRAAEGNDTMSVGPGIIGCSIHGGPGDDTLIGGDGNDRLNGGFGDDTYEFSDSAAPKTDTVVEAADGGTDLLDFSGLTTDLGLNLFNDMILATMDNRIINTGGPGESSHFENVTGGDGNDTLVGNAGDNRLDGGPGSDSLDGNAGNDIYAFEDAVNPQTDMVAESPGGGTDLLDFSSITSAVSVNLNNATNLAVMANRIVNTSGDIGESQENVIGGSGNDTIVGNAAPNFLKGGPGDDSLMGNAGNNTLAGSEGNDTCIGGVIDDTYHFGNAINPQTDVVVEQFNSGADLLEFPRLTSAITVNLNNDANLATMTNRVVNTGGAGQAANFENVRGGAGNDTITGNISVNSIICGNNNAVVNVSDGINGNDTVTCGSGNDTLTIDAGDTVNNDHAGVVIISI